MNNKNLNLDYDTVFDMIYNYGPKLRYDLSRNKFDVYETEYKNNVKDEKIRMQVYQKHFGNAVPSKSAVEELSKYIGKEPVLELDAHLGLWASLLRWTGTKITSTESHGSKYNAFYPIEHINYTDALDKYNDATTLLMVCHKDSFISRRIDEILDSFKGDRIVFICEKKHMDQLSKRKITGTLDNVMSRLKNKKNTSWMIINEIELPHWLNHHSKIYMLEKIKLQQ